MPIKSSRYRITFSHLLVAVIMVSHSPVHGASSSSVAAESTTGSTTESSKSKSSVSAKDLTKDLANEELWSLKRFSGSFSTSHLLPTNDQFDARTDFSLNIVYKLNPRHSFAVGQAFSKNYVVDVATREWPVQDTTISHTYSFEKKFWDISLSLRNGFTLPVSEASQNADVITVFGSSLNLSRGFFGDKLKLSLSPRLNYQWNEYNATSTTGRPLKRVVAGAQIGASYSLTKIWDVSASGGASNVWVEPSRFASRQSQDSTYNFSLGTSVQITKNLSSSLGFSQGDTATKQGRWEVYAYDPEQTEWNLGLTFLF